MSTPTRLLACLASLTLLAGAMPTAAAQDAAPPAQGPVPPPAAAPPGAPPQRPQGMPFRGPGMMGPGSAPAQFKVETTIRLIMLDATGAPTAEGQKILDDMTEEGWRTGAICTVSAAPPYSIAMLFQRVHPRAQQMQAQPMPMTPGPAPAPMQPAPAPAQAPGAQPGH